MESQRIKNGIVALMLTSSFMVSSVFGQSNTSTHDPAAKAKKQTEKMKTELSLTPDQVTKIEAINLKYAQQGKGSGKSHDEMKGIHQQKNKELEAVLTKEQLDKYKTLKAEHKNKNKGQKAVKTN